MMTNAGLDFVQIDVGRIGGITEAKRVADRARERAEIGRDMREHRYVGTSSYTGRVLIHYPQVARIP